MLGSACSKCTGPPEIGSICYLIPPSFHIFIALADAFKGKIGGGGSRVNVMTSEQGGGHSGLLPCFSVLFLFLSFVLLSPVLHTSGPLELSCQASGRRDQAMQWNRGGRIAD